MSKHFREAFVSNTKPAKRFRPDDD